MFRNYGKIHRLGKEETDGILTGECVIQEKVDGANTSIWLENGEICCGSRTRKLDGGFNGFVDYVKNHEGIKALLAQFPTVILYGEWLVRHTISYNETAYKQWYMYDIYATDTGKYFPQEYVQECASLCSINYPQVFATLTNPTEEQIMQYVGKTNLGEKGEGVVIKNLGFVNKFGDVCYAKIVTQEFKEDNGIIFGGNNKHSDTYEEMYVVNKYMTLERVQKIMNKLEPLINERFDMKHIPRIMGTCYHDLITEEMWEIVNRVPSLDFKKLKVLCNKKSRQIYIDVINNNMSVADQTKEEVYSTNLK